MLGLTTFGEALNFQGSPFPASPIVLYEINRNVTLRKLEVILHMVILLIFAFLYESVRLRDLVGLMEMHGGARFGAWTWTAQLRLRPSVNVP